MMASDTSFLLDYLHGDEAAQDFLTDYEDKPFFAPVLALFEVYRGAARTGGGQGTIAWHRRSTGLSPFR